MILERRRLCTSTQRFLVTVTQSRKPFPSARLKSHVRSLGMHHRTLVLLAQASNGCPKKSNATKRLLRGLIADLTQKCSFAMFYLQESPQNDSTVQVDEVIQVWYILWNTMNSFFPVDGDACNMQFARFRTASVQVSSRSASFSAFARICGLFMVYIYSIDLGALWRLIQEIFTLTISGYWRILMILEFHLIWRFEWDEMMKKWKLGMICTWWKVSALTACWRNFCVWLFKWCKAGRCRRHHRRSRKCGRTRPMPAACGRSGIEIHDACIFPRGRLQWKNGIKKQEIGRSC